MNKNEFIENTKLVRSDGTALDQIKVSHKFVRTSTNLDNEPAFKCKFDKVFGYKEHAYKLLAWLKYSENAKT